MFIFTWFRTNVKKAILGGVEDAIRELTTTERLEEDVKSTEYVQQLMDNSRALPAPKSRRAKDSQQG